jgi:hypothetical protein
MMEKKLWGYEGCCNLQNFATIELFCRYPINSFCKQFKANLPSKSAPPTPTIMMDNGKVDAETMAYEEMTACLAFLQFLKTPKK